MPKNQNPLPLRGKTLNTFWVSDLQENFIGVKKKKLKKLYVVCGDSNNNIVVALLNSEKDATKLANDLNNRMSNLSNLSSTNEDD